MTWLGDGSKVEAFGTGVGGLIVGTNGSEQFAFGRELTNAVPFVVDEIKRVIIGDPNAVRPNEFAFAPAVDTLAVTVKDKNRSIASIEDENTIMRIDSNANRLDHMDVIGNLRPVFDGREGEIARADGCHDVFSNED
jgi:hypothetical protein